MLSDRIKDRRILLGLMALTGVIGTLALPLLVDNWMLLASMLLLWGGCVSGMYTVGLTHLGSRLTGSDLVAANAAFIFCYAVGTIAGPQTVGISMDVLGTDGFAWALAMFFGLYVVLSIARSVFGSKQT
jgi:predicted MFS family arabinose efflux permease